MLAIVPAPDSPRLNDPSPFGGTARRLSQLQVSPGALLSPGSDISGSRRASAVPGASKHRSKHRLSVSATGSKFSSSSGPASVNCTKMIDEKTGTYLEINVSEPKVTEEEQFTAALAQRASLREAAVSSRRSITGSRRISRESRRVSIREFDSLGNSFVLEQPDEPEVKESAVTRRAKTLGVDSWSETEQRSARTHMQMVGRSGLQRLRNKLRRLRNTDEYAKALETMEEMRQSGYHPDPTSYATVIQICSAVQQWKSVIQVFDAMVDARIKPDRECYVTAIRAAEGANNWTKAKQLLQEMQAHNLEPDMEAYYIAARACQRGEEWESTFELLSKMHQKGLAKDNQNWSADQEKLPSGLVKSSNSWEDKDGFRISTERIVAISLNHQGGSRASGSRQRSTLTSGRNSGGTSFSGTAPTSTSMSRVESPGLGGQVVGVITQQFSVPAQAAALAEASLDLWRQQLRALRADGTKWELALQILEEMRHQGHKPDVASYNSCLSSCQCAEQWDHVLQLYKDMIEDGHKPDKQNYRQAVVACERLGKWSETLDLIKEMRSRGMGGDDETYRMAIRACERGQQWDQAYSLLGEVIQRKTKSQNKERDHSSPKYPSGGVWGPWDRRSATRQKQETLDSIDSQ